MQTFTEFVSEGEDLNEGEIWDMVKGTAKMVMGMKKLQKDFLKKGKAIKSGVKSQEDYEKLLSIIEEVISDAKTMIFGIDGLDDDVKRSSFNSFVKAFENLDKSEKFSTVDAELGTAMAKDVKAIVKKYT